MDQKNITTLMAWFKILAEPNRLLLLDQIINGTRCNCELGKYLSLSPNLVSHHLSVLTESGLIQSERDKDDARWIYYSINVNALNEVKGLITQFFDENRIQPNRSVCGPQKKSCQNKSTIAG